MLGVARRRWNISTIQNMTPPIGSVPGGRVNHADGRYLCRPAGAAAEPVTIPETIQAPSLGLYHFDLALRILEPMPDDYPMAYALQVLYPIPLYWRNHAARLTFHFQPK